MGDIGRIINRVRRGARVISLVLVFIIFTKSVVFSHGDEENQRKAGRLGVKYVEAKRDSTWATCVSLRKKCAAPH